ncbi:MAG: amidase [Acidimicrobiales bacterium]|nr:amidase [Acidimicrobiales bacterium]
MDPTTGPDATGPTATERLEDELARIDQLEARVRAWVARAEPASLRDAVHAAPAGPLQGFTLGVKDVIDTAELPTERGSPIYRGRRAGVDAACVALARRAGAVVSGKTATTEFAVLTPTHTTNPHDETRTPGGSSSGSAAAVAAGMVRIAFGTQTAGSVIRPAAFCGVAGFKPTYHAVPVTNVNPVAASLDTVGYFATTVADLAAVHQALTGVAAPAAVAAVALRIGVYRSHEWAAADEDTVAGIERAAAALRRAGATVLDVPLVDALADASRDATAIMLSEAARSFAWERAAHEEQLSRGLRSLLAQGDLVGAEAYADAQRGAVLARNGFDAAMTGFDAWLTPAVVGEAPPIATTGDPVFCRVWTMLGGPALTVPSGPGRGGLPVGVQLVGARWADARVLAAGAALDAALAG